MESIRKLSKIFDFSLTYFDHLREREGTKTANQICPGKLKMDNLSFKQGTLHQKYTMSKWWGRVPGIVRGQEGGIPSGEILNSNGVCIDTLFTRLTKEILGRCLLKILTFN